MNESNWERLFRSKMNSRFQGKKDRLINNWMMIYFDLYFGTLRKRDEKVYFWKTTLNLFHYVMMIICLVKPVVLFFKDEKWLDGDLNPGPTVELIYDWWVTAATTADWARCFCSFGKCLFMWRARWSDLAKQRSQTLHLNGLAPVCLR